MNLPSSKNLFWNRSKSNSTSSESATAPNQGNYPLEKRLWRAIDFLHIIVMLFSLYTGIIVAVLERELFEQCPLYAKLLFRDNATQLSLETIDRNTVWGSAYTCEIASFAYLSAFVLSFISLWIHIVFRRVVRTERLLRLPIGLSTLIFALLTLVATSILTDGVIKFCSRSPGNLCSTSSTPIFRAPRWKIISLPIGGWITTLALLLNALARGFQLFAKPKKSPQTLKLLLNQLMINRQQEKVDKESSEYGSQISRVSREKNRSQPARRYSMDRMSNQEFSPELYPYYYPPIPQYRQIKKRSRFQRICCPCLRPRRRRQRSFHEPYRPFVIPDEYFHRLNHLKENGAVPINLCNRHSMRQSVEQQTQTDLTPQRRSLDETNSIPFLGRRRSSVRFEDETPLAHQATPVPIVKKEEEKPASPVLLENKNNELQRNVSFRNNEDDLWTTVTINKEQSAPIQSSHYNRLILENLSVIDTSITNGGNGVTAIHVNSRSIEPVISEHVEKEIPAPPPPPPLTSPPLKITRHRSVINRHKPPPPPPSRCHTTSSEEETYLRHIKPVEEVNTLVTDKYNYNDLSKALKSNVERLKNTFIHAQEKKTSYDKPTNIRSTLPENHSSDC